MQRKTKTGQAKAIRRTSGTLGSARAAVGTAGVGLAVALLVIGLALGRSASAYEAVGVSNAGAIMGSVNVNDPSLADETISVYRNQDYCGETLPAEKYLVSANGRLQNSVVMIDGITRGKPWNPRGDFVITNDRCYFVPHVLVAPKGGTMMLRNDDPMLHNFHFYTVRVGFDRNLLNIAMPKQGLEVGKKKILRKPGLLSLKCNAHPYMQAWVWVVEHPYAVVTDSDGNFELSDVPAGSYKLTVWHEALGEKVVEVTVEAGKIASVDVAF